MDKISDIPLELDHLIQQYLTHPYEDVKSLNVAKAEIYRRARNLSVDINDLVEYLNPLLNDNHDKEFMDRINKLIRSLTEL